MQIPAVDTDGLKQAAALQRMVKAQKLKALVAQGKEAPSLDEIQVEDAEYPELLKKAYRDTDFGEAPRNVIGMVKDIPVPEMRVLILANTSTSTSRRCARWLSSAHRRCVTGWRAKGKVPGERIFVLEPRSSERVRQDRSSSRCAEDWRERGRDGGFGPVRRLRGTMMKTRASVLRQGEASMGNGFISYRRDDAAGYARVPSTTSSPSASTRRRCSWTSMRSSPACPSIEVIRNAVRQVRGAAGS
ncbi:hypothetical protein [Thauera humireducens]|uniref:DUF748 domain-containing protein n=1 Tax=Thauera humireducens TaxID=1134435 RepID=UPI00311E41D7